VPADPDIQIAAEARAPWGLAPRKVEASLRVIRSLAIAPLFIGEDEVMLLCVLTLYCAISFDTDFGSTKNMCGSLLQEFVKQQPFWTY
jgi:hypothetical protein